MDVHLRDLRYFVAVAEELSFTRAAARLFVSQPALSKQVGQLERGLGALLLRRDRRGVSLTTAGAALLPQARELVSRWELAQRDVRRLAAQEAAVLTVGFATAVARGLLAAATPLFTRQHPGWSLRLRQVEWADATAGLSSGHSDVALLWLPLDPTLGLLTRPLLTEQRWVALPAGHRLAGQPDVAFADLLDEAFLALPHSAGAGRDFWLALDQRQGRPPVVSAEVNTPDEAFEAVANGTGVTLVSAGNARIYRHQATVCLPVRDLPPSQLAVAWRADDPRPSTHGFVQVCLAAAAGSHARSEADPA